MYQFRVFREIELISIKLSGEVSFSELIELHLHIFAAEGFSNLFHLLYDERGAIKKISPDQCEILTISIAQLGGFKGRIAYLCDVPRNTIITQKCIDHAPNKHMMHIVENIREAEQFLGYENLAPYQLQAD